MDGSSPSMTASACAFCLAAMRLAEAPPSDGGLPARTFLCRRLCAISRDAYSSRRPMRAGNPRSKETLPSQPGLSKQQLADSARFDAMESAAGPCAVPGARSVLAQRRAAYIVDQRPQRYSFDAGMFFVDFGRSFKIANSQSAVADRISMVRLDSGLDVSKTEPPNIRTRKDAP